MRVRFWGTRGSIPVPAASVLRYGGNTLCVEVCSDAGTRVILDAGSGLRSLGADLMARDLSPLDLPILLTHVHWDHIQGLPFFGPAARAGTTCAVYGPRPNPDKSLEEVLVAQMEQPSFPVRLHALGGRFAFEEVEDGETFSLGEVVVTTHTLHHTSRTLGYRLSCDGATVAYVTDHEPYVWPPGDTSRAQGSAAAREHALRAFVRGADLVIEDAQYTAEEYSHRRGWGHSPIDYCVDVAVAAGVARLALFHHDPAHTDSQIDACVRRAREHARATADTALEVLGAAEGDEIVLRASP
jgi:phosphoribosyl 1,2-cyclic phosphodiesterase